MVLPSSGDGFPHLIQKRGSQLLFVSHLLTYLRITLIAPSELHCESVAILFKELEKQESCFHGSLQCVLFIYSFSDDKTILNNEAEGCGTKRAGQI